MGIDDLVAQPGQFAIAGNEAIGIYSGTLHAAVPDIAVEIGGEEGRQQKRPQTQRHGNQEYEGEKAPAPSGPLDAIGRPKIEEAFDQDREHEPIEVLEYLEIDSGSIQEEEADAERIEAASRLALAQRRVAFAE